MTEKSPLQKSKILYLDTSKPEAKLAVFNGNKKVTEEIWEAPRELSKTLTFKYQEVLKKAKVGQKELTGICVFLGPGSFTGLRIGISFANALSYALKIPIYGTKKPEVFDLSCPQKVIIPFYGAEPKITKPKKK